MASPFHALVWIDHREARVFHFDRESVDILVVKPDDPTHHIHHKANCIGSGHAAEDQDYLHRVAAAVSDAQAILITGPANAKTELVKHIHSYNPGLGKRIAGVETIDHPRDNKLVAHARTYFKADHQEQPRSG